MQLRKRLDVKAVWDSDLVALLKKLGAFDFLVLGSLVCEVCGKNVSLENLGAIIPGKSEVKVTCDDTACVQTVTANGVR